MSVYSSLVAFDAIRILTLHPRQGDNIRCSLETTLLSNKPQYVALSYEWGQATSARSITLNGHQVPIRENLWSFLTRLSQGRDDHVLWIDALCINQDDIAERNQQVQIMSQIYTSASSVWVWIGEDSGNAAGAFDSTQQWNAVDRTRPAAEQANALLEPILQVSTRSYFTRVWIVQEILLAQEVILHCGPYSMEWEAFIRKTWHDLFRPKLDNAPITLLAQARSRRQEYERMDGYATLISDFGSSECFDLRDKVYGLLGLLPEYRDHMKVDYTIPIPVLFFKALTLFEEGRKVRSAEHLRRSLNLTWPQLYSIPQHLSSGTTIDTIDADSPTSIRVVLVLAGPLREIETCRQLFSHGPRAQSQPKVSTRTTTQQSRRRYFTFRFPRRMEDRDDHSYGLSATKPLPGDMVFVFLEVYAAVIFRRRANDGKLVSAGGATMSTSVKDRLALLAEDPDGARLALLRDGLFAGVEARERGEREMDVRISVRDLEGVLGTGMGR